LPDTQVSSAAIAAPNLAPPEPKPATAAAGKVWYLQLGAFSSTAKADELVQKATEKLSKGFPGVMRIEAGGLTKVQAGPFMSDDEAEKAAQRIQDELGVKAYRVAGNAPVVAPAPSAKPADPASAAGGGAIYLQFAAVSTPAAAEAVAAKVKARFGQELPGISQVQAGNLIKVQAGPFSSAAEAETIALAYQQDFGSRPYRVTR
jgi:cell division septation protein DedD